MGFFSNLFGKKECSFCGNQVGMLNRDALVNNDGFICKECSKKCSELIKIGRFTKAELEEHMKYMEKQNQLYEEAFVPVEKKQKFMCIETGIEFADEIAMFRYVSPKANKKVYKELFRYDQIKNYEPYTVNNTNQDGKKYSEVGVKIRLNCSFESSEKQFKNSKNYHPYVDEIKIPRHKNVDSFNDDSLIDYLDKLFGKYEDNSVLGGIKSSLVGTNKERAQMKVASEGLKALGSLAKSKITGNEEDSAKAKENMDKLKDDAADLATGNRTSYTKIANEVENKIWK